MARSNYEILRIRKGADQKEIQQAFRRLALQYHSDRGGDEEIFKEIRQAYDDLRAGRTRQSETHDLGQDDSAESIRKNTALAREVAERMLEAESWASELVTSGGTGTRLFGSPTLGEIELERKANGVLSIKGNVVAGSLNYAGPVSVRGTITSPTRGAEPTRLTALVGNLEIADALQNRYRIENGARITVKNGNIMAGNVFGKKRRINDPAERAGVYTIKEYRTLLNSPNGAIYIANAVGTVALSALDVELDNAQDDVRITARNILIRGSSLTHDVQIHLLKGGSIRFLETHSVIGLSDDATVSLENGKTFSLHELKVKKVRDVPNPPDGITGNETLIGSGLTITYAVLDSLYDDESSLFKKFSRILSRRG